MKKKTRSVGGGAGASAAAPPAANPSPQCLPRPPARSASAPRLPPSPPPACRSSRCRPRRDPLLRSRPHRDASGAEEWGEDREREEGKGGREREIQMWERDSEGGALGPHVTVMKKKIDLSLQNLRLSVKWVIRSCLGAQHKSTKGQKLGYHLHSCWAGMSFHPVFC